MTGRGVLLAVCMLSALLSRAASVGSRGGEGTTLHWQHATTRSRPHSVPKTCVGMRAPINALANELCSSFGCLGCLREEKRTHVCYMYEPCVGLYMVCACCVSVAWLAGPGIREYHVANNDAMYDGSTHCIACVLSVLCCMDPSYPYFETCVQ